ncbi:MULTISPECIES: sulfite oxidase [Roseovarius]|uniref:sulfite oxidase n=1 Tax=Roseovarius TaxID=74030 RepID=UPI00273DDE55|nr:MULTISPECIES: sulfite oxidase [unclassified Roseovarius]
MTCYLRTDQFRPDAEPKQHEEETMKDQINEDGLTVRARDAEGNPQMAEGRLPEGGGITQTDDFFIVHHYAPHKVGSEDWSLEVTKPDGSTAKLVLADIEALPKREVTALLECAGMSRGFLPDKTPGTQFGHGMVGTATWRGPRLSDVLDHLGVRDGFECVILRGGDEGVTQPENMHSDFSKGLPKEKALDGSTILATEMNGAQLPWLHGGPVRLVVPGWFGVWWVKWPCKLEFSTDRTYGGFWQKERYTYQDTSGSITGVVGPGLPRAIIQSPEDGDKATKGGSVSVSGIAWAGDQPVEKVELSLDGGKTWTAAELGADEGPFVWRTWRAEVTLDGPPGYNFLSARCTDVSGRVQQTQSAANRLGYGNNDIQTIRLNVTA